jgi:hypothetical protein
MKRIHGDQLVSFWISEMSIRLWISSIGHLQFYQ